MIQGPRHAKRGSPRRGPLGSPALARLGEHGSLGRAGLIPAVVVTWLALNPGLAIAGGLYEDDRAVINYTSRLSVAIARAAGDDLGRASARAFMVQLEYGLCRSAGTPERDCKAHWKGAADTLSDHPDFGTSPVIVAFPSKGASNLLVIAGVVPPRVLAGTDIPVCAQQYNRVLGTWKVTPRGDVVKDPWNGSTTGEKLLDGRTKPACNGYMVARRAAMFIRSSSERTPAGAAAEAPAGFDAGHYVNRDVGKEKWAGLNFEQRDQIIRLRKLENERLLARIREEIQAWRAQQAKAASGMSGQELERIAALDVASGDTEAYRRAASSVSAGDAAAMAVRRELARRERFAVLAVQASENSLALHDEAWAASRAGVVAGEPPPQPSAASPPPPWAYWLDQPEKSVYYDPTPVRSRTQKVYQYSVNGDFSRPFAWTDAGFFATLRLLTVSRSPETLPEKPGETFRSVVQLVEFYCTNTALRYWAELRRDFYGGRAGDGRLVFSHVGAPLPMVGSPKEGDPQPLSKGMIRDGSPWNALAKAACAKRPPATP